MQIKFCNVWCTILLKTKVHYRRVGSSVDCMCEKTHFACFIFGMGSDNSAQLFVNYVDDLIDCQVGTKITITAVVIFASLEKKYWDLECSLPSIHSAWWQQQTFPFPS